MIHILVAEDDAELNETICRYLNYCGYEVSGAMNGADALWFMENKKYDLIVSDIMMPLMDGFVFAETVRAANKEIRKTGRCAARCARRRTYCSKISLLREQRSGMYSCFTRRAPIP